MPRSDPPPSFPGWYLTALCVAVSFVWAPLVHYFLVQDDFVLLEHAAFRPFHAIAEYFAPGVGQFRPLTRGVYFVLAYRLFGLHATGYHVVSLAVHIVNVVLTFELLRRLRTGVGGALVGATLFGVSSAHFTAIAWATCIQQLAAMTFMLMSALRALDALESPRAARRSLLAYAGALMCLEQAALLPVALALMLLFGLAGGDERPSLRRVARVLRWHGVLMVGHLLFMLAWKTLPPDGIYHPRLGLHILHNAWIDLARTLHVFVGLPAFENAPEPTLYKANVLFVVVAAYHLARRRWREVVFALVFFLATAIPILGLVRHNYYYQTYVIAFGSFYLIALAAGDVFAAMRRPLAQAALLSVVLVTSTALARTFTHRNETNHYGRTDYERSFVVRRSLIAHNVYKGVMAQKHIHPDRVVMLYGRREHATDAKWNVANVKEALGGGSALRLFYDEPDMDVTWYLMTDSVRGDRLARADVFIYSDLGDVSLAPPPNPGGN